ncbi:trimethylamine methyltransferase family protein [Nitratireductor sp. XY-223]|uniref:trimethylamine methyltransferase family protein n=1 Tax=Nitratireductor sp. XY-223 TaxID=2561926 RepID=UPI0010AAE314|nr:trimethylamine methyltransferase family protein [Nitratireductor sp. XY-223]
MRTASRRARRTERPAPAMPAFITRKLPFVEYMREEGLVRIEEQADRLIEEIGIEFRDDLKALRIWKEAGADIKGTRVRLPRGMARELLKTAPTKFTQHARNAARTVEIGETSTVFAPIYGAPFTRCLEKGRRYGSFEDFDKLSKLVSMLPSLHHMGLVICEPCDLPVNKRHLDMLLAHMRNSDKPFLGAITEKSRAEDSVEMARILFGETFMRDNCVIMGNVNTNSPLHVDKVVTEAIQVYCGAGQGIVVAPFILGGAMGPVTTAASIAQALAEAMVCGAFSQLVKPGAPFVLGNFLSSMSLKSGAPTFGMPEPVASNYIIGQLARRLGVPLRCGGSLTASKLPDAQAAAESADSMHSTAMGGANFVLHSAGWMEGGLVTGFEKLVIDADRLGAYQKLLGGIDTDDNALGTNAYEDVEPAGHFLGSAHTMRNYETAYYDAVLSDSESFEQWTERGGKDTAQRAFERWNRMLDEHQAPPLDDAIDGALADYVEKKKRDMPDAWY